MSPKKLGLIHTSATLIDLFGQLCHELIPDVEVVNFTDESLIRDVISEGEITEAVSERLRSRIQQAELAGVDVIMVTCSSIGPAVEAAQASVNVPVMRVDLAMADRAVALAERVGVIATLATTLSPTVALIEQRAVAAGKSVEVVAHLCEGAFAELMSGNAAEHDRMVREALEELIESVDVIVLAQASMARIVAQLPAKSSRKPILSSPLLAVESLKQRCHEAP